MLVRGAASFRRAKSRPLNGRPRPLLATDYQAGLASLRTDNQRYRRQDPRPKTSGPPARGREPTRRSAPNTAEPIGPSIGAHDRTSSAGCQAPMLS